MAPPTTMDEPARTTQGSPREAASAGALLRAAREQQGMHIATLAAAIKVAPRKLEALEFDRWDELPGPTFTRALAQAVCRALKADPQPIMELLPPADTSMLDSTFGTINEPFAGAGRDTGLLHWLPRGPWLIAAIALVLAAALVMWMPAGTWSRLVGGGAPAAPVASTAPAAAATSESTVPVAVAPLAPAAPVAVAPAAATPQVLTPLATLPTPRLPPAVAPAPPATSAERAAVAPPPAGASPGTAAPAGALVVACAARSWVEVVDARGRVLVSRNFEAGETMGLDGPAPLQLVVGNAASTQVTYKGVAIEIVSRARDNVARLELK